jgi:putative NIF3 family GTP cyclohydrolase 1 type 2
VSISPAPQAQTPPAKPPQANAFMRMPQHTGPITALQFIQRIRKNSAPPSSLDTLDYVVAGDPLTAITGIATTAIASIDSLKAAVAANKNLIVTLEPAFWTDNDNLDRFEGNTLFKFKRDFIRSNNLVCFHLHEDWPLNGPSGIAVGMAKELGWDSYVSDPANPTSFKLPSTTLLGLAQQLSSKLDDRTMRVVGDPKLPLTTVAAKWGNATQMPSIHLLNTVADVVIVGYTHEWEGVEYAQDMISSGQKKGLILLGESMSEQAGMKHCAEWLKTFITEVPVDYIPVNEPYWNLAGK